MVRSPVVGLKEDALPFTNEYEVLSGEAYTRLGVPTGCRLASPGGFVRFPVT
jgi:hypothetical protein